MAAIPRSPAGGVTARMSRWRNRPNEAGMRQRRRPSEQTDHRYLQRRSHVEDAGIVADVIAADSQQRRCLLQRQRHRIGRPAATVALPRPLDTCAKIWSASSRSAGPPMMNTEPAPRRFSAKVSSAKRAAPHCFQGSLLPTPNAIQGDGQAAKRAATTRAASTDTASRGSGSPDGTSSNSNKASARIIG